MTSTATNPNFKSTKTLDPAKNAIKPDFGEKKAPKEPTKNVWTPERREKQSEAAKKAWVTRRKAEAISKKTKESRIVPPTRIPQEVPRIGNHWVYDIRYKKVGWRRLILPVRKEIFLATKTYNLPFKLFFANAQAATYSQLQHFQIYSLRAEAIIPVYEGIWSPYMIKNKIRPEALLDKVRLLGFSETQKVIAGFETARVLVDLENQMMQTANWKYAYQHVGLSAIEIGDDLAALVIEHSDRGQVPPPESRKTLGKLSHIMASNWKWLLILAILAIVWGFIIMNYFLPPLSQPQYPGGVTYP